MATGEVETEKTPPKGHESVHCVVVTPETTTLDEAVDFVALPLYDGELGILPGRAPLIGRLGYGELRTKRGTATHRYYVDGGFVQVRDDVVTVLTSRAIPAERIDAAAAASELEAAKKRRAPTDEEQAEKDRALARARAQLHLAAHKS